MPEAPPHRPGHVGYTPQVVDVALRRSRLAGMLSSTVVRLAGGGSSTALQQFPQPQRFKDRTLYSLLSSIDEAARRHEHVGVRQPAPNEFREGVAITRGPER